MNFKKTEKPEIL